MAMLYERGGIMQELEKILEEIDEICVDDTDFGVDCNLQGRSNFPCDNCYECIKDVCKDIIHKHMNDGWIPVEERLPDKEEYCGGDSRGIPRLKRLEIAYMTDTVEYMFGYFDGYKWIDKKHDIIKNVVAWKIHKPYRPEKGERTNE